MYYPTNSENKLSPQKTKTTKIGFFLIPSTLEFLSPIIAGFQVATALVSLIGFGEFAKWVTEIWFPLTERIWKYLIDYINELFQISISLSANHKALLTTVAFFLPMLVWSIFYKSNIQFFHNPRRVKVIAKGFSLAVVLIFLLPSLVNKVFYDHISSTTERVNHKYRNFLSTVKHKDKLLRAIHYGAAGVLGKTRAKSETYTFDELLNKLIFKYKKLPPTIDQNEALLVKITFFYIIDGDEHNAYELAVVKQSIHPDIEMNKEMIIAIAQEYLQERKNLDNKNLVERILDTIPILVIFASYILFSMIVFNSDIINYHFASIYRTYKLMILIIFSSLFGAAMSYSLFINPGVFELFLLILVMLSIQVVAHRTPQRLLMMVGVVFLFVGAGFAWDGWNWMRLLLEKA